MAITRSRQSRHLGFRRHTGRAAKINGGIVNVGSASARSNLTKFTWSFWAKATGEMTRCDEGPAIERGSGSSTSKGFRFGPVNSSSPRRIAASVRGSTATANSYAGVGTYELNVWTHWTMTYDDEGDRKVHIYQNGVEVAYGAQTGAGTLVSDGGLPLAFGATRGSGFYGFNGSLDEIKIFNRVLSLAEIQALATP